MQPKKELWYVSLADLADPSHAMTIHSRADVTELAKLGWEAKLYARASRGYQAPEGLTEIAVTCKDFPGRRLAFEFLMMLRAVIARNRLAFVLLRGRSTMLGLGLILWLLHVPFGIEINGIFPYRIGIRYPGRLLDRAADLFLLRKATLLLTVTPELKMLTESDLIHKKPVVVAPNGVDIDSHHPVQATHDPAAGGPWLGFIGTLCTYRALPLMMEVVKDLAEHGFDTHFTIVGDGHMRGELEDLASNLCIQDRVTFTGRVPACAVGEQVVHCDLLLAFFEPEPRILMTGLSPLKFGTYLALGKPVLLWDQGLIAAADRVPGVFRVSGSPTAASIAAQIESIWQEHGREELRRLGQCAREYAVEHMTWAGHARIIDHAIGEALRTARR